MPLRVMLYDAFGYLKESQELSRKNRGAGMKLSAEEFLSGMKESDRLHPIISIVIYYGEAPWNGPCSLRDMMIEVPEEIANVFLTVRGKTGKKKYHWECQSIPDSSMLVRFFEYDSQIALDEGEIQNGVLHVAFPHSAVLFLRCSKTTPDEMQICITTPGGELRYGIPVMKAQNYTLETIFKKDLLFLLPFYIFSHESRFEQYETNEKELEVLRREYAEIRKGLETIA